MAIIIDGKELAKKIRQDLKVEVDKIRRKKVDGVVIANMAAVSVNLLDAYVKVCEVVEAGGIIVTVDEGRLGLNIKEAF